MLSTQHARMLDHASSRTMQAQINAVNMFWNNHLNYVPDQVAWEQKDYFPSIQELFDQECDNGAAMGDCTTYACAKQQSLTMLGRAAFVVLGEIDDQPHAWVECSNYILDCPPKSAVKHKKERWDLLPIVKLNEQHLIARSGIYPVQKYPKWARLLDKRNGIV